MLALRSQLLLQHVKIEQFVEAQQSVLIAVELPSIDSEVLNKMTFADLSTHVEFRADLAARQACRAFVGDPLEHIQQLGHVTQLCPCGRNLRARLRTDPAGSETSSQLPEDTTTAKTYKYSSASRLSLSAGSSITGCFFCSTGFGGSSKVTRFFA